MSLGLLAAVFGIIFVAELPDKTALASLVLGLRYRPGFVFIGVAAAFAVHVIIALAAGSLLALAPRPVVDGVVAVMFLAGAVVLLRRARHERDEPAAPELDGPELDGPELDTREPGTLAPAEGSLPGGERATGATLTQTQLTQTQLTRTDRRLVTGSTGFWKAASTSFGVLFVAEFGDLTQIAIANLAAKYHDLLAIGIGATLGLWAVGGLAILGGRQLLRWIPFVWIARVAALSMSVLGVISAVHAIAGAAG